MKRKKRKNFLPTLVLIILLWGLLGLMVVYVDPALVKDVLLPGVYLPFLIIFFPASFFTLAVILADSKRGLLGAVGLSGFLLLRVLKLGNVLNLLLLVGILVAIERYFSD